LRVLSQTRITVVCDYNEQGIETEGEIRKTHREEGKMREMKIEAEEREQARY
jgi:hypothetical protein